MLTQKTLLTRLQSSWWFAWIVAAVLALSHVKDAADGIDKVLILMKVRPDALALAQTAEKGEFSRSLTEAAWRRVFWARAFRARLALGAPAAETDEAWKAYIAASEVWSARIMVFIVATEKFYGNEKSVELEGGVQSALNDMANLLVTLRYAKSPDASLLNDATLKIDRANVPLYHFVRGFDQRNS